MLIVIIKKINKKSCSATAPIASLNCRLLCTQQTTDRNGVRQNLPLFMTAFAKSTQGKLGVSESWNQNFWRCPQSSLQVVTAQTWTEDWLGSQFIPTLTSCSRVISCEMQSTLTEKAAWLGATWRPAMFVRMGAMKLSDQSRIIPQSSGEAEVGIEASVGCRRLA